MPKRNLGLCARCRKFNTDACEWSPVVVKYGDVYRHTLLVLQNSPATLEGQLAALLHDVGKPQTQQFLADGIHFYEHAEVGAEIAEAMLRRLKFDSTTIKKITTVVRNHMRPYTLPDASEKALRKFIRDLGDEVVNAVIDLAEADEKSSIGEKSSHKDVERVKERIEKIRNSPIKINFNPVLDGKEIMELLGIGPKDRVRMPEIGKAQKFLVDVADEYASQGKELTPEEAKEELLKNFNK